MKDRRRPNPDTIHPIAGYDLEMVRGGPQKLV